VGEFVSFHCYFSLFKALQYTNISNNKMITVQEASNIILQNNYLPEIVTVSIQDAVDRVLAEPVCADRDFPPFDRVAMDGIAIRFEKFAEGQRKFIIEDVQAAGTPSKTLSDTRCAIEVMTGSVLPVHTDTVVRYEDVDITDRTATIKTSSVTRGQHIHRQRNDAHKEEILLHPNIVISPAEIAVLATVGADTIKVKSLPKAAVVATGNELVDVGDQPELHQIRQSNTYALQATMKQMGWPSSRYHILDDEQQLKKTLKVLLDNYDVIILSGGVSKGKFDFVPDTLKDLGVQTLFHQVSQRPGKPLWFGIRQHDHKTVFALPGNPVSTFMCFHRYVKPWFFKSLGVSTKNLTAVLDRDFKFEAALTFFLQVSVMNNDGKLVATPKPGGGSGDFASLKDVDGFLELPLEKTAFQAGEVYPYISFR
jgi:molybdopterin molybdotransferase